MFHTTLDLRTNIEKILKKSEIENFDIISDEKIKEHILEKSVFAVTKSGTISLEVCFKKIPSIIIYKINWINYFIIKLLVKIKYANIINIAANKMIIPELIQSKCRSKSIFDTVSTYIENPKKMSAQIIETQEVLDQFITDKSPSENVATILKSHI